MVTRLVAGYEGQAVQPVLITDLAEDEVAAELLGESSATILRQIYTILREKTISY